MEQGEQGEQSEQPEKPDLHCKYKEETERCVLNPDTSSFKDDPECYKTEKNRCAKNKKKIIKIKPKKGNLELVVEQEQPLEQLEQPLEQLEQPLEQLEQPLEQLEQPKQKQESTLKKKKQIKINSKKGNLEIAIEQEQPLGQQQQPLEPNNQNDFLYPDLNDKNFNLKISEKKEFYDTRNTEQVYKNKELIERADKLCNAPYELQPHQYFVKNFMSFQTPYNSLLLYHGLGSGKTCSAIGVSEGMRDYLKQMGIMQEIILVSNINVKNNFKKELFDVSKLHRNESGKWAISGCTGNKFLKEINLDLFTDIDYESGNVEDEEKLKIKIKKQIDKIIKKSYSFFGYQKFSSIIRTLLNGEKLKINKQTRGKKQKHELEEGEAEEEEEGEEEEAEDELEEEEDELEEEEDELEEAEEAEEEEDELEEAEDELEEEEDELEEAEEAYIEEEEEQEEEEDEFKIKISIDGIKRLKKYFNNRLIIIDEVHNLKSNNKDAAYLLALVKHADNLRLLFLSATPMFNDPKEIIWLLNLMRVNDRRPKIYSKDVFDSDNNLLIVGGKQVGKERLQEASIGYVSFVRGENPYMFPYRIFPSTFSKEHALRQQEIGDDGKMVIKGTINYPKFTCDGKSTVPGLEYVDVYLTHLKKHQNGIYNKKIEELKIGKETREDRRERGEREREAGYGGKRDQGQVQDEADFEQDIDDNAALSAYSINDLIALRQILNMTYPYKNDFEEDLEYTYGETGIMTVMDKKKGQYKYKNPKERIFSIDRIGEYSSKIKSICDNIVLKHNKVKPSESTFCEGIVLIYTYFIESGAIPMALALEELGFTRYKGASNSVNSKSLFSAGTVGKSNGLHYSLITGNQSISPNNDVEINALRSDNNSDGSACKVVIISKSASEGVDLKNIRQIHIMDPWYNMSAIEQIIGRGVRTCSHKMLPFDKRNIQIFLHASLLDNGMEAADLAMYRFSEIKAVKIGAVSRALKESSIDCILNMKQTDFTEKNLDTEVELELSTGGSIKYRIGDKQYTSTCDYMKTCTYTCSPKPPPATKQNIKLSTFNESFILMNVENIIKVIKHAFREKHFYKKLDLIHFINRVKQYSLLQINFALTQMINDKSEYLTDMYGKYGYLINIGDYYFFQPVELNDPSISIFEKSTPIPFKRDRITLNIKTENVKKRQVQRVEQEEREEEREEEQEEKAAVEPEGSKGSKGSKGSSVVATIRVKMFTENIIASIGYTQALSINTSITKKERNDIADAQDPALKLIPGAIPMISRDRIWYIYCNEMFKIMNGVLPLEELQFYVFTHIMDHLTFEEINALVLNMHALDQIAIKMKASSATSSFASSHTGFQETKTSAYDQAPECAKNILKYFSGYISEDGEGVKYLFVDSRENTKDISKKIVMYYKKGEKGAWTRFNQEELTSTEYNEVKAKFQKEQLAQYVGFMQTIKDGDVVFKVKEGDNRGSVCSTSSTKKRTLQDILQFKFKNVEIPSVLTQVTYCILQEVVLRHYNAIRLNQKVWSLNSVEAIFSIK
jgi:hypothetical protein